MTSFTHSVLLLSIYFFRLTSKLYFYRATHHLLEDLDTMWNLWYTHKLPLKWWLEDRSTPCSDLIEKDTHNSKEWKKKKMNYFQRLPHQMHVEIFCKDYEYERYLVRTNRGKYSKATL